MEITINWAINEKINLSCFFSCTMLNLRIIRCNICFFLSSRSFLFLSFFELFWVNYCFSNNLFWEFSDINAFKYQRVLHFNIQTIDDLIICQRLWFRWNFNNRFTITFHNTAHGFLMTEDKL